MECVICGYRFSWMESRELRPDGGHQCPWPCGMTVYLTAAPVLGGAR